MTVIGKFLIWAVVVGAVVVSIYAAATSPLLAWRSGIYIVAGLAGVVSMSLLLVQPLMAAGLMPGLNRTLTRRIHARIGGALLVLVVVHVAGLWITSPPDVIDALLFVSPTPFSAWGVVAMWAVFAAAGLAFFRRRVKLAPIAWRRLHTSLALVVVAGSVVHAMLIEGTMEVLSKSVLCLLVAGASLKALVDLRLWTIKGKSRSG